MSGETPRILLVEDEYFTARYIGAVLTHAGYELSGSYSRGDEALQAAASAMPDLVILDIGLAGPIDGIEVAERLRAASAVRILFTTGYEDRQLRDKALAIPGTAWLTKPITADDILRAVEEMLSAS